MMAPAFQQCKSHPGRALTDHLLDVADRLRDRKGVPAWLPLVGLFHDLGKATEYFQCYLQGEETPDELKRHAEMGALWLLQFLAQPSINLTALDTSLAFLFVRRHHGRLDDLTDALTIDHNGILRFQNQMAVMDVRGIKQWFESKLRSSLPIPLANEDLFTELRLKLRPTLLALTDEVEAMGRFQSALRWFGFLIESDRDSAAGCAPEEFECGAKLSPQHLACFRDQRLFGTEGSEIVRGARECIFKSATAAVDRHRDNTGKLWTLTVPTGSGKTLAALEWAVRRRQTRIATGRASCPIIYALPFTSIIDQNATVIRTLFGETSVNESLLAVHHHIAEPGRPAESGEESLARSWVEGWRADVVCTTFVQVVNALFHGTAADARRFSRLAGSILILDEVQAIPAELWPVLKNALCSLVHRFGTDILLVTATQPALFSDSEKIEIVPEFLAETIHRAFDRYDFSTNLTATLTLESLRQRLCQQLPLQDSRSCLVILNTVDEALRLHALLKESYAFHDWKIFHLSTNLRPKDRSRILEELATLHNRSILVSTQVVEAGVDLSFDTVFRALAPIDSIVQAAGRCNRHGIGKRGFVEVFDLDGGSAVQIYGPVHIGLAREILGNLTLSSSLPEPELLKLVQPYFLELPNRIGRGRSSKVMKAVQMMQFAALRGEGNDRDRRNKQVQLIEDQFDRIPHFIECDNSDSQLWSQLEAALDSQAIWHRRHLLRRLRPEIAQRIVEVPGRYAAGEVDPKSGLVHIPLSRSAEYYDKNTGWKRGV